MLSIADHILTGRAVLAPMAGVTDLPFRELCRAMGAALAPSEMVSSNPACRDTRKTRLRLNHHGESSPRCVQIVGSEPEQLAAAAAYNVHRGADIIDINMGCPAKKVCSKAAGSALLRDEGLVDAILKAVVGAIDKPVTLKIRTGWDRQNINAIRIARIAEEAGISALTIHGRTRACRFEADVDYDVITQVVNSVTIPVIANGDIHSARQARDVLQQTGAAGIMIGRAAQGNPWIFRQVKGLLEEGCEARAPSTKEFTQVMQEHLVAIHRFYGPELGVRIARKHIGCYFQNFEQHIQYRRQFNRLESATEQCAALVTIANNLTIKDIAA